jgi:hypothetical protein
MLSYSSQPVRRTRQLDNAAQHRHQPAQPSLGRFLALSTLVIKETGPV